MIKHHGVALSWPQENGATKRKVQTLMVKGCSMLRDLFERRFLLFSSPCLSNCAASCLILQAAQLSKQDIIKSLLVNGPCSLDLRIGVDNQDSFNMFQ